jgi:hypothetical protein
VSDPALESLDERVATDLLDRLLREAKQEPVQGWVVTLADSREIDVDRRLGTSTFGIEWVSPQDRVRYGTALPAPDPGGQLRLVTGSGEAGAKALILLLDHESYRFGVSERALVPGEPPPVIARRLRRDLLDFLSYTAGQAP